MTMRRHGWQPPLTNPDFKLAEAEATARSCQMPVCCRSVKVPLTQASSDSEADNAGTGTAGQSCQTDLYADLKMRTVGMLLNS